MLSNIPVNWKSLVELGKEYPDVELVRIGVIAELDAVNLYEQLASLAKNEDVKNVFLDIAREEKEHFGEFMALLNSLDKEIVEAVREGGEEVNELKNKIGDKNDR